MDQSRQLQDYLENYDRSVDMIGILLHIKAKWKLTMMMMCIGGLLSTVGAFLIPKVYQASIIASKGHIGDIVTINQNGMTQYTDEQLFKLFYDRAKAKETFKQFIESKDGVLSQVFVNEDDVIENKQKYLALIYKMFNFTLLSKGRTEEDTFLSKVNAFKLTFDSENEALGATLMNQYLPYVQSLILTELAQEERVIVAARLAKLTAKIELERSQAKTKREFEIARKEESNAKLLADLEQKKSLLIEETRQNRLTEIANLEEANRLTLDKLNQKRQLILVKAKQERLTEIAQAQEALKIAKSLGIVDPTLLEELNSESNVPASGETNINLTNVQELPLYLMGSKFLETKIKTLSERNNDEQFLEEIHLIDMEINTAKNDRQIAQLKARESDEQFIVQLNEYNSKIAEVKNDPELAVLKARTSDDPYIKKFSETLTEIERLEQLNFDFADAQLYVLDQAALISGKAIKPKRGLIVLLGFIISGVLTMIVIVLSLLMVRYRQRQKL